MDQTLDQVIKTRKIKFNGRSMKQQGGQKQGGQKQQFVKRTGGPGFVKNQFQRRQNFVQFRPRGQFVRNFNQRRPQQQFARMNNMMMFGGVQKRTQGGQFMMGNRQNFQQRRPFGQQQFVMQRGFVQQQRPQFRRNMMQMFQPRRMNFQQRNNFGQMRFQQNRPAMRQNQPTKLYISNLDFGVTNQDVKELFSEFGPMVRYGVNFSAGGRSVGSAEVFFKNKISAIKAMQKYNGVTLDGRPMKLEIAGGSPVMQNQQVQRQQQRPMMQQRLPQGMARNNMNKMMKFVPNKAANNFAAKKIVAQAVLRRAKNFGVQKQMGGRIVKSKMMKKKMVAPDAEQLDADLEAYAASKDWAKVQQLKWISTFNVNPTDPFSPNFNTLAAHKHFSSCFTLWESGACFGHFLLLKVFHEVCFSDVFVFKRSSFRFALKFFNFHVPMILEMKTL